MIVRSTQKLLCSETKRVPAWKKEEIWVDGLYIYIYPNIKKNGNIRDGRGALLPIRTDLGIFREKAGSLSGKKSDVWKGQVLDHWQSQEIHDRRDETRAIKSNRWRYIYTTTLGVAIQVGTRRGKAAVRLTQGRARREETKRRRAGAPT
jgi:hypothetical protein